MTAEELLDYGLTKPGARCDEPWEGEIVAKVGPRIFALLGDGSSASVACGHTREEADELLTEYPDDIRVMPYLGRSGWNVVAIGGKVPDEVVEELIDQSDDPVVAKLPARLRPAVA